MLVIPKVKTANEVFSSVNYHIGYIVLDGSLPCSQGPVNIPYPEPYESNAPMSNLGIF